MRLLRREERLLATTLETENNCCNVVRDDHDQVRKRVFRLHKGSLGFAVMNRQFWRQLHCRPPAVQLLA
jgi:hypothetical protein